MPKLLWMSPYSLHDEFSSAAINCKLLLEGLAQIGWEITACTSFILEDAPAEDALSTLKQTLGSAANQVLEFSEHQVHYVYIRSRFLQEDRMSLNEMQLFYEVCCELFDKERPDFVMGFGTSAVFQTCMAEAKRRGIWTLYMLLNANHQHYNFPNIDFILTSSQANADLYYRQWQIRAVPIGEVFDVKQCIASSRTPRYITFFNPALEMGLSFFARIAYAYNQSYPEQRFLVVNNYGNFARNLKLLHCNPTNLASNTETNRIVHSTSTNEARRASRTSGGENEARSEDKTNERAERDEKPEIGERLGISKGSERGKTVERSDLDAKDQRESATNTTPLQNGLPAAFPEVLDVTDFSNVDLAQRTPNLKSVYALSKVILMPTLWWEAWGRIATEATLNSIPVVASNVGGLVESTGGAGIHIPIPEIYLKDYRLIPDDEALQPWLDGLQRALHEDLSQRIAKAQLNLAVNQTLSRIQSLLLPLHAQQRSRRIAFGMPVQWTCRQNLHSRPERK